MADPLNHSSVAAVVLGTDNPLSSTFGPWSGHEIPSYKRCPSLLNEPEINALGRSTCEVAGAVRGFAFDATAMFHSLEVIEA